MEFREYIKIREEKFGSVIFDTLGEKVFITNKTGSVILQLLKENKLFEEIIEYLLDRYDEDGSIVTKEVISFIDSLREEEVLV